MRKSKEILLKLNRIDYLLENPFKFKKGDMVFYTISAPNYQDEDETWLFEKCSVIFSKLEYDKHWDRFDKKYCVSGIKENVHECRLHSKDDIKKLKDAEILSKPTRNKIKVSEYLKLND